jgi:hypothetical protein
MRYLVVTVCCVLIVAAALFSRHSHRKLPPVCRVVFGTTSTNEILVGISENELLIYRDGQTDSAPETYPMVDGKLAPTCAIPPFKYGSATFTLSECYENISTDPTPRHSLMLHGTIADKGLVFKQYCDVAIRSPDETLDMTHFDGPLTVGIQSYDWRPIPLTFTIGGEPTDVRTTIGTTDKNLGCWATIETGSNGISNFDDGIRPIATIEFPAADQKNPIVKRYELSEFC